jgi:hypothetical protein
MEFKKSILQFQSEDKVHLYDFHQRLIHPRLYQSALEPNESLILKQNGIIFPHKNQADFGVILSHDVDHIYSTHNESAPKYSGGFKNLSQLIYHEFRNRRTRAEKPSRSRNIQYDIFRLIEWEMKNNIPASYYFLALDNHEEDFNYQLEEIRDVLVAIKEAKGEIGLHGGHLSTGDLNKLNKEKSKLEQVIQSSISGFRSHYLKWSPFKTENFLQASSFLYDTSWGCAQQPGFIKGFCTPHPVWNHSQNQYYQWVEIPLVAMDCSFFDYMRLSEESAWSLFLYLVSQVKAVNGILTILWHNSYIKKIDFYWRMLEYLKSQNCYFGTSIEFANLAVNSGYIQKVKDFYA